MEPSLKETNPDSFVHLHLHTQYSLLDGAIRLKDLMEQTKELGMPAVAITDHGNMFGAIDFYKQCKSNGIKPILGCEIYFTSGSRHDRGSVKHSQVVTGQDEVEGRHQIHHLVLICKNMEGYHNLCQIVSKAYLEGFYYKPRADIEILKEYSEGLICLTACLKGEVAYNFFTGQDEKAYAAIEKLQGVYGEDFYLEIQENGLEEQEIANKKIVAYAREHNIKLVATNDCHYLTKEDSFAQEVLLSIQTGKTFADEKRMKLSSNEFYFKTAKEMRERFHYAPDACDNTLEIADKCSVEFKWTDDNDHMIYHLPDFPIDTGEEENDYFMRQSREGLEKRFAGPHFKKLVQKENWLTEIRPKYIERLESELEMIVQMEFPGYFLIVSDFIKWSKKNDIPVGPGRGSGAGSLVAYSLYITNIDPLPFNLLFERFINPERISMPDFDIDFCQSRRYEVIDYVTRKYGSEKVSQIITFGKLQAKAVIRDVSRVFNLPYSEADMLSKLVPEELGMNLEKALEMEPKFGELMDSDPKIRQIINISKRLEGLLRHASIHAAGVIITSKPLTDYCPLFKGKEGEQVSQYDKDFSEQIGLVKFDFLGLKTLTVIHGAVKFIQRDKIKDFDIEEIDLEDQVVYDFISSGDTVGVFQLESSGMIDLCKRIMPNSLDDITAINALYRPGPLESGMVDDFIEIKHGRKQMSFAFDILEPVLKDTYGVIVYQEQVMNIARCVAGYSLGGADMLRRAMGKKKVYEMDRHREIFRKGAIERGYDEKKALDLFELMANFAAYGFNKSHAVAYGLIAYQTAFLKKYYPAEFFASLLTTELNNTDKVTNYINDCQKHGIEVHPPDVNESLWVFNVVSGNIRYGMGAIKNVGRNAVNDLVSEREENGPYESFKDFCERINYKSVNKRTIESLIKVGCFDFIEKLNRKTLLENLETFVTYGHRKQEEKLLGQCDLFDGVESEQAEIFDIEVNEVDDYSDKEKLEYENQLLGIYVSGHPLDRYIPVLKQLTSVPISDIEGMPGSGKRNLIIGGLMSQSRVILTKKGDKMCFSQLEDHTGKIELIIFPRTFAEFENLLLGSDPLIIEGNVNLDESPRKFFPTKFKKIDVHADETIQGVRLNIDLAMVNEQKLHRLKKTLMSFKGSVPAEIILNRDGNRGRLALSEQFLVNPTPKFAQTINDIFNENTVSFIVDGKINQERNADV